MKIVLNLFLVQVHCLEQKRPVWRDLLQLMKNSSAEDGNGIDFRG
mgnify:CR=1 FL=1